MEKRRFNEYIGSTLGNYRILKRIGSGGMGTVFLARDLALERDVALKVISPELARNPVLMNRFRVEAIAQAKLNHNNIVTIHTFCKDDSFNKNNETYYFVMEYVDGTTLKNLIQKDGPMPVNPGLKLFAQILDGMGYAHARGVVHRDIKPANIFFNSHHIAKIGDFGIAKVEGIDGLTRMGSGMGSPMYSAPEQLLGQPTDARSDIFSLGMTLYEMLTGTPPVKIGGSSGLDSLAEAAQAMPARCREINPAIPVKVDDLIMKSIAKDPADRFQTIQEFKNAVNELLWPMTPVPDSCTDPAALQTSRAVEKTQIQTSTGRMNRFRFPKPAWKSPSTRALRQIAAVLGIILTALVAYMFISSNDSARGAFVAYTPQDQSPGLTTPKPTTTDPGSFPTLPGRTQPATHSIPQELSADDLLSRMRQLIDSKQYRQALNLGKKANTAGQTSGELFQLLAMASFFEGDKDQSAHYLKQALDQDHTVSFPLLFESSKKRFIRGNLAISYSSIAFINYDESNRTGKTLLSLSINQVKDVFDDTASEVNNLFRKKKNRKNPILIIKDQQNRRYSLQMSRNDAGMRRYIRHIINSLRKT